jgi:hypothetical protein
MSQVGEERKSRSDVIRERAALREMLPGVVVLTALQGSLVLVNPRGTENAWNVAWSLLPMVPALWLVWAQLRSLRRADEYQRVVQLEAMATGFATVMVLSLAGGILDAGGIGDPRQSLQVTFIAGTLTWLATLAVKTARAR